MFNLNFEEISSRDIGHKNKYLKAKRVGVFLARFVFHWVFFMQPILQSICLEASFISLSASLANQNICHKGNKTSLINVFHKNTADL